MSFLTKTIGKLFGNKQDRDRRLYDPRVEEINAYAESFRTLSHDELRQKTLAFRTRISDYLSEVDADLVRLKDQALAEEDFHEKEVLFNQVDEMEKQRDQYLEEILRELLPEAFAVVKETARRFSENETITVTATDHDRNLAASKSYIQIQGDKAVWKNKWMAAGAEITWNMVHYDVQLIGGMVLHDGKIAEMATGEGKTLVSTLPAYLNGLAGKGVHIITVNDYLARRDSEWNGPIYEFLLLTVDCIDKYPSHTPQRRQAYQCDITYGTNNEFGFDYLRDNMVRTPEEMVQAKHHFAMVDEVDSVLIDDARTPLIISGPVSKGADDQEYNELNPKIKRLIDAQQKLAAEYLAEARKLVADGILGVNEGEAGMALLRAHRALPKYRPLIKFLSEEGVKVLLQKTENFYMQEQSKNMHLVDEPLLFTIDEKNRQVDLTDNGAEFMARGNEDPGMFVLPDLATRMMEIEQETELSPADRLAARQKLTQEFAVKSNRLHAVHQLLKAYTLFDRDQEYVVVDGQVKIVDEQTGRMMEGRRYSDGLHQALEAKENVKVGEITQTYATITLQNYFRMYHKLAGMTGTAETEAGEFWEIYKLDVVVIPTNRAILREDRDDLVFKTAREKYNAVIDEIVRLREAGRPVLVGTTSVDISEKLSRMLQMRAIPHNVLNAKQHQREAEVVTEAGRSGTVTIATNMAGRGTDIKIDEKSRAAGGLAIIGTERHDSRRVDRQLRGRSGRQGDPGSSQFFVSLEDNLMRLFHSERIAKLMDRMGHKEGEVIQHPWVTKSIEKAQRRVEENNFGIRKRLLEYDDVMNIQREAIYTKRKNALHGDRLAVDIHNMFSSLIENVVLNHRHNGDYESFRIDAVRLLGIDPELDPVQFKNGQEQDVIEAFRNRVDAIYRDKGNRISEVLMPLVRQVHDNEGHRYKRIALPFTDGSAHPLAVSADLKLAVDSKGRSLMTEIEKTVTLALIDDQWKEHLRSMDELKDSVQSASFEQKDPLVIYKMEAYNLFEQLIYQINEKVSSYLLRGTLAFQDGSTLEAARTTKTDLSKTKANRSPEQEEAARAKAAAAGVSQRSAKPDTFIRQDKKIGRNDPCPCGSGKKYKQCHGS
ncbi:MAG: preprotein translocase subunit SecA [Saprospiraceae bacterium]|nr:preprotein translocase subunit SecA [Saprospiraceae bacterium]